MVTTRSRKTGFAGIDLLVALGIVFVALLPLSASWVHEQKLLRVYYYRLIATEIVDGELERLSAGDWTNHAPGVHRLQPALRSVTNLPPGEFRFVRSEKRLRVEWKPAGKNGGGNVIREVEIR